MIAECENLLMNEKVFSKIGISREEFNDLMQHVRLFFKEKNRAYLEPGSLDAETLIHYFNEDIGRDRKIFMSTYT